MHFTIETEIILLLMVIISVAMSVRYFSSLPYTIALIFAGAILSFFDIFPDIRLTSELIFHVLLPPLLFEAAFNLFANKRERYDSRVYETWNYFK